MMRTPTSNDSIDVLVKLQMGWNGSSISQSATIEHCRSMVIIWQRQSEAKVSLNQTQMPSERMKQMAINRCGGNTLTYTNTRHFSSKESNLCRCHCAINSQLATEKSNYRFNDQSPKWKWSVYQRCCAFFPVIHSFVSVQLISTVYIQC